MKRKALILLLILIFISNHFIYGQLSQTIRGRVVEKVSKQPLIGATVVLSDSIAQNGTITNDAGDFKIDSVNVGRHNILISYVGYETVLLDNLLVTTGKEVILNIDMEEKVYHTEEVVIKAYDRKDMTNNKMAVVSARKFTIEESNKYPSAYGDISRMVVNFSGVQASSNQRNDIIIRGNNPMGLLWRLEGIDIPNPNHFNERGTSGGVFTIINNNVLSNSDFFTGAFPADYGNALSGVFDVKMRAGNNFQREYAFQSGFSGLELGLEGPFSNKTETSNISYLLNYRISTIEFIDKIGINISGYIPKFQDISFKINIPNKNKSKISIFGIGGLSSINVSDEDREREEWTYENAGENVYISANIGVAGITYTKYLNTTSRIENTIAITGQLNKTKRDSFHISDNNVYRIAKENFKEICYLYQNRYFKKVNKQNSINTGISVKLMNTDFDNRISKDGGTTLSPIINTTGSFFLIQGFGQYQYKFTENLLINSGLHFQYFTYNNTYSIEPRLGIKWNFTKKQSFNIGFGYHSQIQPLHLYEIETEVSDNIYTKTNTNLGFSKAIHYVVGYGYKINRNFIANIEVYYQDLHKIPVKKSIPAYSLLNAGANYDIPIEDSLINEGTGRNYGIEFTLQKYLSKNYYFLVSTSLFESKYNGYDKIERNTVFCTNFIINVLGGYEHKVGKNNLVGVDVKTTWAGGKRYVPIDLEKSVNYPVYDWANAYTKKRDDYFTLNAAIYFTLNKPKYNVQIMADFQNMTNHKNIFVQRYDPTTGGIRNEYQLGFLPSGKIKIEF